MVIYDTTDILQVENLCSEIHITCHICPKGSIYIGAKGCLFHQSVTRLFECLRISSMFSKNFIYIQQFYCIYTKAYGPSYIRFALKICVNKVFYVQ